MTFTEEFQSAEMDRHRHPYRTPVALIAWTAWVLLLLSGPALVLMAWRAL